MQNYFGTLSFRDYPLPVLVKLLNLRYSCHVTCYSVDLANISK